MLRKKSIFKVIPSAARGLPVANSVKRQILWVTTALGITEPFFTSAALMALAAISSALPIFGGRA